MKNLSRCLALSILSLALIGSRPVFAADAPTRGVDYVIGMLEAGVAQPTIISKIYERNLTFRISEGDLDRLRAAGAGEDLIQAVTEAEGHPARPQDRSLQDKSQKGGEPSSHPRRIDRGAQGSGEPQGGGETQGNLERQTPAEGDDESLQAPQSDDENGDDQDRSHGGYPYYRPGEDDGYDGYHGAYAYYGAPYYPYYYDYYPFSFYYSYYYPSYYYYPYGYYYPYRPYFWGGGRFTGHGPRVGPGVPRGSSRGSWSGPSGRPSSPRGGSAPHPHPRGH